MRGAAASPGRKLAASLLGVSPGASPPTGVAPLGPVRIVATPPDAAAAGEDGDGGNHAAAAIPPPFQPLQRLMLPGQRAWREDKHMEYYAPFTIYIGYKGSGLEIVHER